MKKITLAKGRGFVIVDDDDFPTLSQYKWRLHTRGYAQTTIKGKDFYMHRMIMNAPKGAQVDHIDGDKLNNERSNLRFANNSQNNTSRPKTKRNTTGYKGVVPRKNGMFIAKVVKDGKQHYFGFNHLTAEDAAAAYNKGAQELHGQFAYINEF